MKVFILSAVLAVCTVSSLGTAVASDGSLNLKRSSDACCPCPGAGYCPDKTPCTPHCGYGPCNIFACNCDRGCRGSKKSQSENRSVHSKRSSLEDNESSDLFDTSDTNKDGKMTFDEWRNSPARSTSSGETHSMLADRWAKFDTGKVGYLTKHQAINRKA